ncbi:hypothetical protein FPSM_02330 [Flavobacterium psychrophilum]|nr:hypothetical protein FPSM_02330 [Flavobacterium psychrophilum]
MKNHDLFFNFVKISKIISSKERNFIEACKEVTILQSHLHIKFMGIKTHQAGLL